MEVTSDIFVQTDSNSQIQILKNQIQVTEDSLKEMQDLLVQEHTKLNEYNESLRERSNGQLIDLNLLRQIDVNQNNLKKRLSLQTVETRKRLDENYGEILEILNAVESNVLDVELRRWKREQQLAENGKTLSDLGQIQKWCEDLVEIIWQTYQQIKRYDELRAWLGLSREERVDFKMRIKNLYTTLITSALVIEKQPPQVLKKDTKFSAKVRLLFGNNVHMFPDMKFPTVEVSILDVHQAKLLLKQETQTKLKSCGELLNNSRPLEYDGQANQLSATFQQLQLHRFKRPQRGPAEVVMDTKFTILFRSEFRIDEEIIVCVWTLSLPVVVIVHVYQEPQALGTILWDNNFAQHGRVFFDVPEEASWIQIVEILDSKFTAIGGRGLTYENRQFLAAKAFRDDNEDKDYSNENLTWTRFCKENMPGRKFTFWQWFHAILKLTEEHLRGLWHDEAILGFLSRTKAEEMLRYKCIGTFLMRFSDSELGGISIAFVQKRSETLETSAFEPNEVFMVQPFTSKDLTIRSLADRINDLKEIQYLFPEIPKHDKFSSYYSPPETDVCGRYVKITLKTSFGFSTVVVNTQNLQNLPPLNSWFRSGFPEMAPGQTHFEHLFPDEMDLTSMEASCVDLDEHSRQVEAYYSEKYKA